MPHAKDADSGNDHQQDQHRPEAEGKTLRNGQALHSLHLLHRKIARRKAPLQSTCLDRFPLTCNFLGIIDPVPPGNGATALPNFRRENLFYA
ncbi:MAG TPA: hypothetical protein PKC23_04095 [Candidatus Desulfobacillus sp.]|nr:hypothetical protein [Candidatus Desulfobacillus sp.]